MDPVIDIVERSNQRGGRMFSVIDLLEAGTLNTRQTSWLLRRIEDGSSWMVGAKPGGAGKTMVMSALLAMLPAGETVRLTNPGDWERSRRGDCLVAYEIGSGPYDAYIWGQDVRRFAALGAAGCRLVTNLHADTLEEARDQIVRQNGVTPEQFAAFGMFLPISFSGAICPVGRVVRTVHYHAGGAWREFNEAEAPSDREKAIASFIDDCRRRELRVVADVRRAWLAWRKANC